MSDLGSACTSAIDSDESGDCSLHSDVPEDEIDTLLDGVFQDLDEHSLPEERIRYILEERGNRDYGFLPEGWLETGHNSGMPIYLHRTSRVCTMSRPYFIGKKSLKKHDIPVSAIPCLQYIWPIHKVDSFGEEKRADSETPANNNKTSELIGETSVQCQNVNAQLIIKGEFESLVDSFGEEKRADSETPANNNKTSELLGETSVQCQNVNAQTVDLLQSSSTDSIDPALPTKTSPLSNDALLLPTSPSVHADTSACPVSHGLNVSQELSRDKSALTDGEYHVYQKLNLEEFREYCQKRFSFKTMTYLNKGKMTWRERREKEKQLRLQSSKGGILQLNETLRVYKKPMICRPQGWSYGTILQHYFQGITGKQLIYEYKQLPIGKDAAMYSVTVRINSFELCTRIGNTKKVAKNEASKTIAELLLPKICEISKTADKDEVLHFDCFKELHSLEDKLRLLREKIQIIDAEEEKRKDAEEEKCKDAEEEKCKNAEVQTLKNTQEEMSSVNRPDVRETCWFYNNHEDGCINDAAVCKKLHICSECLTTGHNKINCPKLKEQEIQKDPKERVILNFDEGILKEALVSGDLRKVNNKIKLYFCTICNMQLWKGSTLQHLSGKNHNDNKPSKTPRGSINEGLPPHARSKERDPSFSRARSRSRERHDSHDNSKFHRSRSPCYSNRDDHSRTPRYSNKDDRYKEDRYYSQRPHSNSSSHSRDKKRSRYDGDRRSYSRSPMSSDRRHQGGQEISVSHKISRRSHSPSPMSSSRGHYGSQENPLPQKSHERSHSPMSSSSRGQYGTQESPQLDKSPEIFGTSVYTTERQVDYQDGESIEGNKSLLGLAKKIPDNAATKHPVMVLHAMRPDVQYSINQILRDGHPHFTVSTNIDGTTFTGEGLNVKKAKFALAQEAIRILYGVVSTL